MTVGIVGNDGSKISRWVIPFGLDIVDLVFVTFEGADVGILCCILAVDTLAEVVFHFSDFCVEIGLDFAELVEPLHNLRGLVLSGKFVVDGVPECQCLCFLFEQAVVVVLVSLCQVAGTLNAGFKTRDFRKKFGLAGCAGAGVVCLLNLTVGTFQGPELGAVSVEHVEEVLLAGVDGSGNG